MTAGLDIILHSQRLRLRPINTNDIEAVHALHSMPQTDAFNTLGIPDSIHTTEQIVNGWLMQQQENPVRLLVYCIELAAAKQFIGLIGLIAGKPNYYSAEVWYKIHPDYWRNGYATEALILLLDFCFAELKLHRVEAGCAVENTASARVLEKAGLSKEGTLRKKIPIRGEWKDNFQYAILEEDYFLKKDN